MEPEVFYVFERTAVRGWLVGINNYGQEVGLAAYFTCMRQEIAVL
jgi:hypothetical protein